MRNIGFLGVCVLLLAGCEKEEAPPDADANAQYQQGYDMGHAAGVVEERAQLCGQIANHKAGMAAELREAGICPKS